MNRVFKRFLFVLFTIISSLCSYTPALAKPQIEIEKLRVILLPSVARSTAVYGEIKNTGDELDTLIKVSSNAGIVMLHQTEINSGRAQMNHIENYVIK